jgi:WD domain, G-beta repeat
VALNSTWLDVVRREEGMTQHRLKNGCTAAFIVLACLLILFPHQLVSQTRSSGGEVDSNSAPDLPLLHLVHAIPTKTSPSNIVWSSDGTEIAAFTEWGNLATVWGKDGTVIQELHRPGAPFSGDGLGFIGGDRQLVTPPAPHTTSGALPLGVLVSVFDIGGGTVVREIPGPRPGEFAGNRALITVVSPDGSMIAAVTGGPPSGNEPVRIYSSESGLLTATLTDSFGERGPHVTRMVFSRNSEIIAVGRSDGSVLIYDTKSLKIMQKIDAFTQYLTTVMSLAISPNNQFIAVGTGFAGAAWRYPDGRLAPLGEGRLWVFQAPDPIRVYRVSDGTLVASKTMPSEAIYNISWSSKGGLIAFVGIGDALHLWNPRHPEDPVKTIHLGSDATSVAFSPDGSVIATGEGSKLNLYDVIENK